jgi:hypothetical protein
MGADLLLECFWEEMNEQRMAVTKPDWKKGHVRIDELCDAMEKDDKPLADLDYLGDYKEIRKALHDFLGRIKNAYATNDRELTKLEFYPYRVWITGGMSWGDEPTTLFQPMQVMSQLDVLEACGLNPGIPDYKRIVQGIVKQKDLQPLLIGKDEDLDKMLDIEMRKPKRKRK